LLTRPTAGVTPESQLGAQAGTQDLSLRSDPD
jgi:hypothetical protein